MDMFDAVTGHDVSIDQWFGSLACVDRMTRPENKYHRIDRMREIHSHIPTKSPSLPPGRQPKVIYIYDDQPTKISKLGLVVHIRDMHAAASYSKTTTTPEYTRSRATITTHSSFVCLCMWPGALSHIH